MITARSHDDRCRRSLRPCQARRERLTVRITPGRRQRCSLLQRETRVRNSRWLTSPIKLPSARQKSKAVTVRARVVPVANFAPSFLACKLCCCDARTSHNTPHAAGRAVEGAELEDWHPAPEAQWGRKRGRTNKKNSMSKCELCRKKSRPCGPACPHPVPLRACEVLILSILDFLEFTATFGILRHSMFHALSTLTVVVNRI